MANISGLLDKINSKIPDSAKELLDAAGNIVAVVWSLGGIAALIISEITGKLASGESNRTGKKWEW